MNPMRTLVSRALPVWLLVLLVAVPARAGRNEGHDFGKWEWSSSEQRKIKKMLKDVEKDGEFFVLEFKKEDLVVRTDISAQFCAEFAMFMLTFVERFPKIFPVDRKNRAVALMTASVYKNQQGYASATGVPESRGLFSWAWNGSRFTRFDLSGYAEKESEYEWPGFGITVLQHEGTHAMLQKFVGRDPIPVFLNEGAATYFESWNLGMSERDNREVRASKSWRWPFLVEFLETRGEEMPNLKKCMTMTPEEWSAGGDQRRLVYHYTLAESFIDFLLSTKSSYRKYFQEMMDNQFRHRPYLLEDKDYERLEPKWHEHIKTLLELGKKQIAEHRARATGEPEKGKDEAEK